MQFAKTSGGLRAMTQGATGRTMRELKAHQIELETQNEALRAALRESQERLDDARARCFDLHNLAPVGYCTLSEQGLILEANLTASDMLGVARGALLRQPVTNFIVEEDQGSYDLFAKKQVERGQIKSCELQMVMSDGTPFWTQLTATAAREEGAPVLRLALCDISERKAAQQVLTRRHAAMMTILDGIRVLAYVADSQTHEIMFANRSLMSVLGRDDLVGQRCCEIIPCGAGAPRASCARKKLLEAAGKSIACHGGEFYNSVNRRWYAIHNQLIEWPDGRVVRLVIGMDITRHKKTEEALRLSEAKSQALIDAIPDLIFENSRNGVFLSVHAADPKLLFVPPEDFLHRRVDEVMPALTADRFMNAFAEALDSRAPQTLNYSLQIDGRTMHFEARVVPCAEERIITIVRDITERRQTEQTLELERSRLRALMNAMGDPVAFRDRAGRYQLSNPAYAEMFGRRPEDIVGIVAREFVDGDVVNEIAIQDAMVCLTAKPHRFQMTHWRDGHRREFDVLRSPVFDDGGSVEGVLSVLRDLTERYEIVEAVRTAERLDRNRVGLAWIDRDGRLTPMNHAVGQFFGIERLRLYGERLSELCFEAERALIEAFVEKAFANGGSDASEDFVVRFRHDGGGEIWSRLHIFTLDPARLAHDSNKLALQLIDMTEHIEGKQTIELLHREAIAQGQRLEAAVEREKARLSRELHDELGQLLTALNFQFNFLRKDLRSRSVEIRNRFGSIQALIDQSLHSTKHLSRQLRPWVLEQGLLAGLQWLVEEHRQHIGVECILRCKIDEARLNALDSLLATTIFRIVQEALTNSARHSRATRASIAVDWVQEDRSLLVTMRDDGVGFDVSKVQKKAGGLGGIHDRVGLLGGRIVLESAPGNNLMQVFFSLKRTEA
jgi:PAS domain S-box-containing protein